MNIDLRTRDALSTQRISLPGGTVNALQVAASIAPSDGGPATAIVNINRHLRELGSNSLIIATDADGPRGRVAYDHAQPIDRWGAAVVYCRRSWPYALKNSWSLGWRTVQIARTADVMHIHGVYLANSIYGYLASRLTGTPYVLQPHGTLEPYQQATNPGRKRIFNAIIGHRIIRGASRIIAASSAEAENIRGQYPDASIAVVPLGVQRQAPERPTQWSPGLDRWLSAPAEKRVIFLGRLARKKRPDLLARAWHDLPDDAQLLFVGPPQDWTEAMLRERLSTSKDASVHFISTTDARGVAWCLSEAGIFVLPSDNENFGIAVVEAMNYECAVISTSQTAATEHVQAAGAGITLDSPTEEDLRNTLGTLLANPSLVRDMGRLGRRYTEDNLTWAHTSAGIQGVYDGALSG